MNKEVVKLTEEIGKVYVEISKLKARKEVLDAKIWEAKSKDIIPRRSKSNRHKRK